MNPCDPACPWAFFGPMLVILAYFLIGGLLYTVTKSKKVVYAFTLVMFYGAVGLGIYLLTKT